MSDKSLAQQLKEEELFGGNSPTTARRRAGPSSMGINRVRFEKVRGNDKLIEFKQRHSTGSIEPEIQVVAKDFKIKSYKNDATGVSR